jgi:predicted O-methyltransferase YrrM
MKLSINNFYETIKIPKIKFIYENIKKIKNPNIIEFGVRKGVSTSMFLYVCNKNKGKLLSVDIVNYEKLYTDKNWTFLESRDDNFSFIKNKINKKLDVIYIDSYHEPNHIKKILFYYYRFLKKEGLIFIDDISWLPYVKKSYRDNEFNEIINRNTFNKIIEIYSKNIENVNLEFSFSGSGTAKIQKLNNKILNEPYKITNRIYSFKNILKILYRPNPAN